MLVQDYAKLGVVIRFPLEPLSHRLKTNFLFPVRTS